MRELEDGAGGVCRVCHRAMTWQDAPTGGWWIHDQHPEDGHDAEPREFIDPPTRSWWDLACLHYAWEPLFRRYVASVHRRWEGDESPSAAILLRETSQLIDQADADEAEWHRRRNARKIRNYKRQIALYRFIRVRIFGGEP